MSEVKSVNNDVFNELSIFGTFHRYQYFLICLPVVMIAMMNVNYIFVAEKTNYRCRVPECENDYSYLIPSWWPDGVDTECYKPLVNAEKYNVNNFTCTNDTFHKKLEICSDWVYEDNNSIIAELNLGCQTWKLTLIGSMHNAGMIFSVLFMGWLADKIGRQPTLIICSVGGCVGVLKIFVDNYELYLLIEFLESLASTGISSVAIILLIELGGDSKRVQAGVVFSYAVCFGEIMFAVIAKYLRHYKLLILAVYSPVALFGFYGLILRESIRWEMLRGRILAAKDTFKIIAKMNQVKISHETIDALSEDSLRAQFNVEEQKEKESIGDIIASKEIMIRVIVTSFCFFTASFIYFGLAVQSVLLPGDKYTNFMLTAVASCPGDLLALYIFDIFGRKYCLQCGYIVCAVFLIVQSFISNEMVWFKVILFLLGKVGIALSFTGIFTYTLELFPTSVRGSLMGVSNTAARVGGLFSPLTPLLNAEYTFLPSVLFSITAVIATLLLTLTPETKSLPMFDTIAQVEAHKGKNSSHV